METFNFLKIHKNFDLKNNLIHNQILRFLKFFANEEQIQKE